MTQVQVGVAVDGTDVPAGILHAHRRRGTHHRLPASEIRAMEPAFDALAEARGI